MNELAEYLKDESETLRFNAPVKIEVEGPLEHERFTLRSLEEKVLPFLEINAKDLYNQLSNNSMYLKVLLSITALLIIAIWINYMMKFLSTIGLSKNKRKKQLMKKKSVAYQMDDHEGEESKSLNPKEMLMSKVKQYEFLKKKLTGLEIEQFLSELRNPGILVEVLGSSKDETTKQKILRLDKDGNLYWSKESASDLFSNLFVRGQKQLKSWPCTSMTNAYLAEQDDGSNSFMLELKGNCNLHLATVEPLTAQRMVTAFKSLINKLKRDPFYAHNVFVDRNCQGSFTIESALKPENETASILRRIEE